MFKSEKNQIIMTQEGVNILICARADFWKFSLGGAEGARGK